MAPGVTVSELSRRLIACTEQDGKVTDLSGALEILKTLETTKVTVSDLQELRLGRLVNMIRKKNDDSTLSRRARKLIRLWQKVADTGNHPAANNDSNSDPRAVSGSLSRSLPNGPKMTPKKDPMSNSRVKPAALQNGHNHPDSKTSKKTATKPGPSGNNKRKNTTLPSSSSNPAKRAKVSANHNPPHKSPSEKSLRKSHQQTTPAVSQQQSLICTNTNHNGLKIKITKHNNDTKQHNTSPSTTKVRSSSSKKRDKQKQIPTPLSRHHHLQESHRRHHSKSPDSIDSDRTTLETSVSPPEPSARLKSTTTTAAGISQPAFNHAVNKNKLQTTTRTSLEAKPSSSVKVKVMKKESLPVHFDVKDDPFFCSTLQPSPESVHERPKTEQHGIHGCLGDNGTWYPWKEGILLKHRTQVVTNDPLDEGLLCILPYVEVE